MNFTNPHDNARPTWYNEPLFTQSTPKQVMNMSVMGRFAPTPSGELHLGNLFCFLLAWLSARSQNGSILLRIEDLDAARCRPEAVPALMDDLRWLGLDWDRGPFDPPGAVQSQRTSLYEAALRELQSLPGETRRAVYGDPPPENIVYPCFCTRAELHAASAPHRADGQTVYPGTCRDLSPSETAARMKTRRPALRLRVPDAAVSFTDGHMGPYRENPARDCGDFLVRRSDGVFAYQLAVVVDDALMGVTEVVRGADLLSSTPRQLLLYRLLNHPAPRFFHLPLLLSGGGRRLSKRDGDLGVSALRQRLSPEELTGRLAYLGGFNPTLRPGPPSAFLSAFSWDLVPRDDITVPRGLFA